MAPLCWLLAICFGLFVLPVEAGNRADISGVHVSKAQGNLLVDFAIQNCFTPKLEEAIQSGVAATFRVRVVVEEQGLPLLKSQLVDLVLEHRIDYDPLTDEYRVELPERPEKSCITKSFEEAKAWMSQIRQFPVIPLSRLQPDKTYQMRLKADLSNHQMPLFLRYVFFFIPLWDFESDWQKVTFNP